MTIPQPNPERPHQNHLRVGRWSESYQCYAITKSVENRLPVLATREPAEIILSCFDWHRRTDRLRLLAFCIMPDHYHVLFYLMERGSLSDVMKSIGKFTARQINEHLGKKGQFWQEGYYDHRCRDEDDIDDRLLYIEHNPVREDLVQRAEQWPYSSAFAGNASRSDRDWYADVR